MFYLNAKLKIAVTVGHTFNLPALGTEDGSQGSIHGVNQPVPRWCIGGSQIMR